MTKLTSTSNREWIVSSHGRRSITWSKELRAKYGLGKDKSDEELASETEAGDVLCEVDRELWWQIVCTRTGARARFLAHLDTGAKRPARRSRRTRRRRADGHGPTQIGRASTTGSNETRPNTQERHHQHE